MPLEIGGRADKMGNRYEIRCIIYVVLCQDLVQNKMPKNNGKYIDGLLMKIIDDSKLLRLKGLGY